jgi:uncharacterized membrane protein
MTLYFILKYLHIVGATVLLGTGAGIAFFMLLAHRTGKAEIIAAVAQMVVVADFVFTASTVVMQPITGALLMNEMGIPLDEGWVALSLALYVVVGLFWLPVVWMQMRLRDLAREAAAQGTALPAAYHRLFRAWFWSGFPAFVSVLTIVWLMIAKPVIRL